MKAAILCIGVLLSVGACKKGSGGGGGGGSSWLVGASGMMVNVQTNGAATGYKPASTETLNAIACRSGGEAFVVGTHGTLLYTSNAGASWQPQAVPTTADLRAVATQDEGPVFVAGNGVFLVSTDTGAHWTQLSDATTSFRAVAAAQEGETVLAVASDGTLFSFQNNQLVKRGVFAGARAVAVSPDGLTAILAGDNLLARSSDAGQTWSALASPESVVYDDVRLDPNGQSIAVGTGGAIAHVAVDGNVVMQHIGVADLHTVHIAEAGEGADGVGVAAGESGAVWITQDGGWTWRPGPNAGNTVFGADQIGDGHR